MSIFTKIIEFFSTLSLSKIIPAIVILIVAFISVQLLMRFYDKASQKSKIDQSLFKFFRTILKILLYFLAVLISASTLGIDVTSLIALLSVVSLAISLAIQGVLSNIAGGIMILTSRPFKQGDYIEAGSTSGTVMGIGLSYTKLISPDNKEIFVPNSDIASERIVNYSALDKRRVDLSFSASYDNEPEVVKKAIYKACEEIEKILKDEEIFVKAREYRENDIEYVVRVWVKTQDYWGVYFEIIENVKKVYDQNGISMVYPRTHVKIADKA